jgi:hypothetical protein
MDYVFSHLARFGLHMHIGRGDTASKTEAVYFPGGNDDEVYERPKDLIIDDDGFISFTDEFKYLGSYFHYTLTTETDVDKRIQRASAVYGALRESVFNKKHVRTELKGRIYSALVQSILLYGCEIWSLKEVQLKQLQNFHRMCVRSMCNVIMRQTIKYRVRTNDLLCRVGLDSLRNTYHARLLRWAGHVVRMPLNRAPRKLLQAWINHKREQYGQKMNWGHTLKKALKAFDLPQTFHGWSNIALNKTAWKQHIYTKLQASKKQRERKEQ